MRILLSILLVLISFPVLSQATEYYVDGSCTYSGNGLSASCAAGEGQVGAWKTLATANSGVTSGGNTINVAAGTYAERVSETHSGSAGNYIWWKASGTVHMRGFDLSGSYLKVSGFDIETETSQSGYDRVGINFWDGTTYNIADSNTVHDCPHRGIFVWQSSYHTISNNTITRCAGAGFYIAGSNLTITNNTISDIRNYIKGTYDPNRDLQADAFYHDSADSNNNNVYTGNYVYGFLYANQTYTGEPPHIDIIQGAINNALFDSNHFVANDDAVHANTAMHGFMMEGGSNVTFQNNIFEVHNIMNSGGGSNFTGYLRFYNNTFRGASSHWDDPYESCGIQLYLVTATVTMNNNIFVDFITNVDRQSGFGGTLVSNYNEFWMSDSSAISFTVSGSAKTFTEWKGVPYNYDANSLNSNPLFVTQWSDLQLQSGSPCKDAGTTIAAVTDDYAGVSRPQGAAYDIGAYEYVSSGSLSFGSGGSVGLGAGGTITLD